jgi:CheY-like chemotaxis protein
MTFDWNKKTVLIAEDEPANYLFLEKILKPTHAKIIRAHDGHEALKILREQENIDLILLDIYMPGMDGFEAAVEIRKLKPRIPIIAQTCYEGEIEKEKLEKADFDDFIRKPININKLMVLVEKHLKNPKQVI